MELSVSWENWVIQIQFNTWGLRHGALPRRGSQVSGDTQTEQVAAGAACVAWDTGDVLGREAAGPARRRPVSGGAWPGPGAAACASSEHVRVLWRCCLHAETGLSSASPQARGRRF